MSEGPEVKRTVDKISEAILGKTITDMEYRNKSFSIGSVKEKIINSRVISIDTHGKNIIVSFSSGVYLRNHMMMWGKWRIYSIDKFNEGKAKPPPRIIWKNSKSKANSYSNVDGISSDSSSNLQLNAEGSVESNNIIITKSTEEAYDKLQVKDVRNDSRVRLILKTFDKVAVQFNGPILEFTLTNPLTTEKFKRLGPDGLKKPFDIENARARLYQRSKMKLADLLLDQTFIAGVGNKYKSEILFVTKCCPFRQTCSLSSEEANILLNEIPKVLETGYVNGRTRPKQNEDKGSRWNNMHWVFRRGGHPCWICGTKISADRKNSSRVTFYCPKCQDN